MGFDRAAWRGLNVLRGWAGFGAQSPVKPLAVGGKKAVNTAPKPCGSRECFWYVESDY